MDKNDILFQAVGELKEANRNIASSMGHIKDNLKTLNDHNILHAEKSCIEHKTFSQQIQLLTGKYWWLIIALICSLLIVMGYQEVIKVF